MPEILHITTRSAWEQALGKGSYEPSSLTSEGFIHLSDPHQVAGFPHLHGALNLDAVTDVTPLAVG